VVVAGDTALARVNYLHYEAQRVEVNKLVPTPPLFGRRSKLVGEVLRRCSRFNDAATIRDAIEQSVHAMRISSSPGARRACRCGKGRSGSPEFADAGIGEDNLARSIEGVSA
jgi:hypothetical protein